MTFVRRDVLERESEREGERQREIVTDNDGATKMREGLPCSETALKHVTQKLSKEPARREILRKYQHVDGNKFWESCGLVK